MIKSLQTYLQLRRYSEHKGAQGVAAAINGPVSGRHSGVGSLEIRAWRGFSSDASIIFYHSSQFVYGRLRLPFAYSTWLIFLVKGESFNSLARKLWT